MPPPHVPPPLQDDGIDRAEGEGELEGSHARCPSTPEALSPGSSQPKAAAAAPSSKSASHHVPQCEKLAAGKGFAAARGNAVRRTTYPYCCRASLPWLHLQC